MNSITPDTASGDLRLFLVAGDMPEPRSDMDASTLDLSRADLRLFPDMRSNAGESVDIHRVLDTPTEEIGRWVVKISCANYALEENRTVRWGNNMADDRQILYDLAQSADNLDWTSDDRYEYAILYKMKRGVSFETIAEASEAYSGNEEIGAIGKIALRDGLARIGFLPRSNDTREPLQIPSAEVAALGFLRADTRKPLDRKVLERKHDITKISHKISALVTPRRFPHKTAALMGQEREVMKSAYNLISGSVTNETIKQLGLDPSGSLSPWWQELARDLRQIDQVQIDS